MKSNLQNRRKIYIFSESIEMSNSTINFLVLVFILVAGAISFAAHAESENRLQIQHRTLELSKAVGAKNGQMLVEVINTGKEAINVTALSIEDAGEIQTLPVKLHLGRLEPAQVKSIRVHFQSLNPAEDNSSKSFVWRINYHDLKGIPQQTLVVDSSQNKLPTLAE
jgi:hypothetical protein